jgi:hypothetical protein
VLVRFVVIGLMGLAAMGSQSRERDWTIYLRRVGPLTIGTSLDEVRRIVGDPTAYLLQALKQEPCTLPREPDDAPCAYLVTEKIPAQIGLMFQHGRLVRVDVVGPGIRTEGGAQVGEAESRILELYGRQISVTPHHYPPAGAHYMIYAPTEVIDREYQMLFETDGAKVINFRVGTRAAVAQPEGCA